MTSVSFMGPSLPAGDRRHIRPRVELDLYPWVENHPGQRTSPCREPARAENPARAHATAARSCHRIRAAVAATAPQARPFAEALSLCGFDLGGRRSMVMPWRGAAIGWWLSGYGSASAAVPGATATAGVASATATAVTGSAVACGRRGEQRGGIHRFVGRWIQDDRVVLGPLVFAVEQRLLLRVLGGVRVA